MRAVRNLGPDYGARLAAVYEQVAEANDLALVPFLLEGVGGPRTSTRPTASTPAPRATESWREASGANSGERAGS